MATTIRPARPGDTSTLLAIVNAAAQAYRGAIPADCWHEPYMPMEELLSEIAAGVAFSVYEADGAIVGVMGIQPVRNVDLIRHAYVKPEWQGRGVGRALLDELRAATTRPILIGTWAAATWAIRFYEGNGFRLVPDRAKAILLRAYWTIPERQIDTSVVLSAPPLTLEEASRLAA